MNFGLNIDNCTFVKNSSPYNTGGAIHITHTMLPHVPIGVVLNNTKFIGNFAKSGGAIVID